MGRVNIYLNPGFENFRRTLSGEIYVDKTMMIARMNRFIDTGNNYVCVSRPRRFGKTIANNMLSAYYSKGCDAGGLFAPLKISSVPDYKEKMNRYNVIQIDMNSEYQNTTIKEKLIHRLTADIREEMRDQFPTVLLGEDDSLAQCIQKIYAATGETFVILMDEYDVLVREQVSEALFSEYMSFLNGLFKSNTIRPAISLAYLTGILPIVRDKIQSKLNNFEEYTILDADVLAEYVGFTGEEVRQLCSRYGADFETCRRWYDGYRQYGLEIYNPESVVKAVRKKQFGSYWGKTSTYEAITERIRQDFEGTREEVVRMLSGESVDVNVTRYMNTMTSFTTRSDLFTYLIHLGYLAYNMEDSTCRIPNFEVRQEWFNAIEAEPEYAVTNAIIQSSRRLLEETTSGNAEAVAKALDVSHIHVTSNRSYNNEDALQSAIYLAFIYALNRYTIIKEMTSGKGFADVVFIPFYRGDPAMVIELKRNDCTESALNQIRQKQYFDSLLHYKGSMLLVGINYDEKAKTHTCAIERLEKS
ncbi:MAG: AAA family ATPase [Sarcina sp.]|nr:AAA family ATPase [Sarcina sp.]